MIFQDPYASLMVVKVRDIIAEGDIHGLTKRQKERDAMVDELLETVGLIKNMPTVILMNYRRTTSAVRIARALAVIKIHCL